MMWGTRRSSAKLSPTMLYLLGAVGVLVGLFMGLGHASFLAGAQHARGEVMNVQTVSHHSGRRGSSHSTYLDVRFVDARGAAHTFHSKAEGFGSWHLHDSVDVAYPAGSPQLARIGGFGNQWMLPLLLFFGGLASIAVGWFRAGDPQS